MRSRESILLEFSQCLNLFVANDQQPKFQNNVLFSKAISGVIVDAEKAGVRRQELSEFAAQTWLPKRNGNTERRQSLVGFLQNQLVVSK